MLYQHLAAKMHDVLDDACAYFPDPGTGPDPVDPDTGTACPKCGKTKKGQESCCGRGGSWFNACGDPGGPKEHTWPEGIDACKGKLTTSCFVIFQ